MLKVKVKKGDINRALKEYKGKIIKTKQMREIKERKEYKKPSVTNREIIDKGKYKQKRKED